jgi:AcrR family transcriptional regulator
MAGQSQAARRTMRRPAGKGGGAVNPYRRPAGGDSRQTRSDTRRRKILDAALHCFTTAGFASTTLADIRRHARASIGSIYHHFKSKEQLAGALYIEGLRDYQRNIVEELRSHREASRAIRGVVRRHLKWVESNPDWSRYLFEHRNAEFVVTTEGAIAELNSRFFRDSIGLCEPYFDSGQLMRLPADLFAAILIGPSQEFARHWLAGRRTSGIRAAADILGDAAWHALAGHGSDD